MQVLYQLRSGDLFHGADAPGKGQESRSRSKTDHVRERIKLPAEVRAGVGEAGDSSVQSIEKHRVGDGFRRPVKGLHGELQRLVRAHARGENLRSPERREDRVVPADQCSHGEKARQHVKASPQLAFPAWLRRRFW